MANRCEKCQGEFVHNQDGNLACPVCDPPKQPTVFDSYLPPASGSNSQPESDSRPPIQAASSDAQSQSILPPTTKSEPAVSSPTPPPKSAVAADAPPIAADVASNKETSAGIKTDSPKFQLTETISESERVLLPNGDGGFVEVSERVTKIDYQGAKVTLESMKRDEKEATRGLKNFLVITFCVVFLLILMFVLSWYQSPAD